MARKTPYAVPQILTDEIKNPEDIERTETIEILDDIAALEPGKNAQIAAKKISEKYKKIREAKKRRKYKLLGEIVQIQVEETPQGKGRIPVSVPPPGSNVSEPKTAKKISEKYEDIRRRKAEKLAKIKGKEAVPIVNKPKPSSKSPKISAKKISDKYRKIRSKRNIDVIEEIRDVTSRNRAQIAAKNISNKYKKSRYKKPPPTFLVDEVDTETIGYNDNTSLDDVVSNKSATTAANKIKNKYKKSESKKKHHTF